MSTSSPTVSDSLNTLFEHDIEYECERNHFWDGINRPDFQSTRNQKRESYSSTSSKVTLTTTSSRFKSAWEQMGWTLIERGPGDVASTTSTEFASRLIGELEALGCRPGS